jgi:sugar fermentation stimulation protein A
VELLKLGNLVEGVFLERLGRFVVRVSVGGSEVLAHNTNTGRLADVLVPGRRVLLQVAGGRLGLRLVGVEDSAPGCFCLVDTLTQGRAFERAVELGLLPYLRGCTVVRRNPRVGGSTYDYELDCGGRVAVVEVKSAVMRGSGGEAMYPDCPTARGRRHIEGLIELAKSGVEAYLVFVAAICKPTCFRPYCGGDPRVCELVPRALSAGVVVRSLSLHLERSGTVYLDNPDLPLCLGLLQICR